MGKIHDLRGRIFLSKGKARQFEGWGRGGVPSPYAGGVQVGSPEPPFKINDIHSMHVVEVLVYTHLLV